MKNNPYKYLGPLDPENRWRSDKLIHIYSFKVSRWLTALTVDTMFNRWWALGKWRWVRIFVKSQETLLYQPF
jgi:hypothetical protein